jgi:acyl-CoA reductase-like NAD-dependent aldehyde dehydrogenase
MHYSIKVPGAIKSGQKISVSSPFEPQKVIGSLDTIDEIGAEKALSNATALFEDRSKWLAANKRMEILEKAADLMHQQAEQLAELALQEGGKPLLDSRLEVSRAIEGIKNCIDCIKAESGKEIPMQLNSGSANRLAFTTAEPIGVVVAVSAFNHPLNLIVHQIGPAIASGCPVIIKPAEDTPLSCFFLVDILRQVGLPDGWCQPVVTRDLTVAQKLVTDPRVAFFSFIGSAKVGWFLRSQLAAGTRCALEHGGAAPVILAQDADLEAAIPSLVKGGFYHAGQVCVSVQRVFVHREIIEKAIADFCNQTKDLIVGDPSKKETEVGPLIRAREVDRVEAWVDEAVEQGASLLTGGKRINDVMYQPTILLNPPKEAKVSQLEIFGPVVCLYSYVDIDDAIKQANSLSVAFQAAVYSRNIDTAMYTFKHLNASAVMINDHTAFRVDWMPFAGLKQSGQGVGGISYTYKEMQIKKMAVIKSPSL